RVLPVGDPAGIPAHPPVPVLLQHPIGPDAPRAVHRPAVEDDLVRRVERGERLVDRVEVAGSRGPPPLAGGRGERHHELQPLPAFDLLSQFFSVDHVHGLLPLFRLSTIVRSTARYHTNGRAILSSMNRTSTVRKRRSDGERSRQAILYEAAQLATVDGLTGLSIGRLAEAVGMSKSGLFAHFGSKEELQLATIDTASEIFAAEVVDPALAEPSGIARLRALSDRFLEHVERKVFPGGCFFASVATEMDTHP